MFENQVGTSLARLAVTLPFEEPQKLAGGRHLIHGQGNGFGVNRAWFGYGFA
jgi:hypothetical protein